MDQLNSAEMEYLRQLQGNKMFQGILSKMEKGPIKGWASLARNDADSGEIYAYESGRVDENHSIIHFLRQA